MATHAGATRLLAWAAVASCSLYFLSDVIEVIQGGFSPGQLGLTLVAEALVPAVVVGLAVVQWPRIGRLGVAGAIGYAYSFVFFTGTVVYALARDVHDFTQLGNELGVAMTAHGALMVFGGLAFGYRTAHAGVVPRWTGVVFAAGVAAVAFGLPGWAGLAAAGVRDLALAGMGASLLTARHRSSRDREDVAHRPTVESWARPLHGSRRTT